MEIYIIEDYKEKYPDLKAGDLTEALIKECLEDYGIKASEILRTPKGKPYIDDYEIIEGFEVAEPICFSVSHSGKYFVCAIADKNIGIDIQDQRKAATKKIADRYFTEEEIRLIEEGGDKEFFFIWARKEAYSKYTGKGLQELMQGTPVLDRTDVEFTDFQLEEGMWCSCCIEI